MRKVLIVKSRTVQLQKKHGDEVSTLTRRHQGQTQYRAAAAQQRQLLTPQQEVELVKFIQRLSERALLPTRALLKKKWRVSRNGSLQIAGLLDFYIVTNYLSPTKPPPELIAIATKLTVLIAIARISIFYTINSKSTKLHRTISTTWTRRASSLV